MKKRILSVVLVLTMLLAMAPATVFAAGGGITSVAIENGTGVNDGKVVLKVELNNNYIADGGGDALTFGVMTKKYFDDNGGWDGTDHTSDAAGAFIYFEEKATPGFAANSTVYLDLSAAMAGKTGEFVVGCYDATGAAASYEHDSAEFVNGKIKEALKVEGADLSSTTGWKVGDPIAKTQVATISGGTAPYSFDGTAPTFGGLTLTIEKVGDVYGVYIAGTPTSVATKNDTFAIAVKDSTTGTAATANTTAKLPAIAQGTQTLSLSPNPVPVTVGKTAEVTVSGARGTISIGTSSDTGKATATLSGNKITVTGVAAGSATLTVDAAATTDYAAAAQVTLTINVSAGETNTVTITNKPTGDKVTWGDNDNKLTLSATATKGTPTFTSGTTATATVDGNELTIVQAGTTVITAAVAAGEYDGAQYAAGSDHYTLTVEEGTPAITFANTTQAPGSISAVTATAKVGTVDVPVGAVKYEVPNQVFTQADCDCEATNAEADSDKHTKECAAFAAASNVWKEWSDEIIVEGKKTTVEVYVKGLTSGTVNVQVEVTAVANKYTAKTETGTMTITAPVSGGGGGVSNNFTVTYNAGAHGALAAGAKSSEQVKRNESPKNVPAVVANAGYAFIGWTADGKTLVNPAAQTITKNTTFTAVYGDHLNYMVGRSAMEFVPNGNLTRAEAAAILSRLTEGFAEDGTYPAAPYSDLVSGAWYVKYINFAADKGIVNGRTDGTFDPDANITRAEFATMIANFAKIAPVDTAAVSTDVAGHWAEGYIAALEQAKIVTGYEDGTFKPNNSITRAEAVTMVNGAIGRVPMTGLDLSVNGYDNPFVDVNESQWFYGQVMEATVDHVTAHFHK